MVGVQLLHLLAKHNGSPLTSSGPWMQLGRVSLDLGEHPWVLDDSDRVLHRRVLVCSPDGMIHLADCQATSLSACEALTLLTAACMLCRVHVMAMLLMLARMLPFSYPGG